MQDEEGQGKKGRCKKAAAACGGGRRQPSSERCEGSGSAVWLREVPMHDTGVILGCRPGRCTGDAWVLVFESGCGYYVFSIPQHLFYPMFLVVLSCFGLGYSTPLIDSYNLCVL